MSSKLLAIDDRSKSVGLAMARPNRHSCHEVAPIDPTSVLDDATLSLYCLDPVERVGLYVRRQTWSWAWRRSFPNSVPVGNATGLGPL